MMNATVIGVDAHKRSHTAVVLDDKEEIDDQVKVVADRRQVDLLLAWAARWPERVWAIENAYGLGRLLAQRLVARGEVVVDVPGRLTARTRRLSGHSARKTDEFDARSVAIVGAGRTQLRRVGLDDTPAELRVLLDRRWHLVSARHRVICRLHDRLTELTAGGAKKALSPTTAAKTLRPIRADNPADAARRQAAKDLLDEWRWLNRITVAQARVDQAVAIHGTTLTDIVGIGTTSAAAIIAIVDDPTRFPTRDTSRPTAAPRPSTPRPEINSATGSTGAATASSTRSSTPPRSPRSEWADPAVTTTTASSPKARSPSRPSGR